MAVSRPPHLDPSFLRRANPRPTFNTRGAVAQTMASRGGAPRPVPAGTTLFRNATVVATFSQAAGDIKDAAIYVTGNVITWVGPTAELPDQYQAADLVSPAPPVPALDMHAHRARVGDQGRVGAPLQRKHAWLFTSTRRRRCALLPPLAPLPFSPRHVLHFTGFLCAGGGLQGQGHHPRHGQHPPPHVRADWAALRASASSPCQPVPLLGVHRALAGCQQAGPDREGHGRPNRCCCQSLPAVCCVSAGSRA